MAGVRTRVMGGSEDVERKQLMQELRDQKLHVQRNKEVLCEIDSNRLDEAVRRLDHAVDKGASLREQKAKEVSTQADILRQLAACGAEAITKLAQQQQGRGPMELVTALRAMFVHTSDPQRDGEEDPAAFQWAELGAFTAHLRKPVRGMHILLGAFDAQPKERKAPAQRQKRQALAEIVKPEELKEHEEQGNKQDTDRNFELMWNIIQAQKGPTVPVADLVLNHASFSQTVENLFTLSFLVKDNRVALLRSPEGYVLRPLDTRKGGDNAAGRSSQIIISIDEEDWRNMCQVVPPESTLMPHRQPLGASASAGGSRQGANGSAPKSKKARTRT